MSNGIAVIITLFLFTLIGFIFLPQFLTKRAASRILHVFQTLNAISPESARTPIELGLAPLSFTQRLSKPGRDYKPMALNALITADIIRSTPDGKLYLEKTRLAGTPFEKL